jgi:hypothetical protein
MPKVDLPARATEMRPNQFNQLVEYPARSAVCYLGIDPGTFGGLVSIFSDRVAATPMPETDLERWSWFPYTDSDSNAGSQRIAVIEKVSASPQMGVTSAFTFGCGYGKLLMALTACGIQFEEVRPQVWQKALGIPKRARDEKQPAFKVRLLKKAQQLYPQLDVWKEPKYKQLAVADALLIATFCMRKHTGTL